ncbi:MAG: CehA/McbA family metallohydrolase [Nevskia sp.]
MYLPFDVPPGVNRIDAEFADGSPATKLGLGLFDERGTAFLGGSFRGISGEERRSAFIAGNQATLGFVAGAIRPGRWTVVVPNFLNFSGTAIVRVTMHFGDAVASLPADLVPEAIDRPGPAWYRGDLHVHSQYSSDAFGSGKALLPRDMALRAQARGLDFLSLTDHNVTDQNGRLAAAGVPGFLLLGGEEVTTWVGGPGHMTVAGLQTGEFVDWRFRPASGPYARTALWKPDDRPIQDVLAHTRALGVYTAAAHPYVAPGLGSDWGFFYDSANDPSALPDGLEIWNDDFTKTSGDLTLRQWDVELARGRHLCGNGGSDVHGVGGATEVGNPTTVVYATSLSRAAIVSAMRACRMYVTAAPNGPGLVLTATGPDAQAAMMGDAITGAATDVAMVSARVTGGSGAVLTVLRNGIPLLVSTITSDDQSMTVPVPLAPGGGVRAELRQAPSGPTTVPLALSNPIFLRPR